MATFRICAVDGCDKKVHAGKFCGAHYHRFIRHGDPLAGGSAKTPFDELDRFYREVVLPFDGDACLDWPFNRGGGKGYAMMREQMVTRMVCEERWGPPPTERHQAAHSCGRGQYGCVSPMHLSWKTPLENAADKQAHGTHPAGAMNGHAKLSEDDVREIRKDGRNRHIVAREYGITATQVSNIVSRKHWSRVA